MPTIDDYTTGLDGTLQAIAEGLRGILDDVLPHAEGKVWHGHPVWLADRRPVAGFKAHPRYVTFMIWNAGPITDPSGTLTPGPRMATVQLAAVEDLDAARVRDWLVQAVGSGADGAAPDAATSSTRGPSRM
ncbi:DUF1801 domain-containing protein [Actinomadura xylanilytica]|uniref:DUF1801 domain-containing protein n=1 Tax=Actinomadura xylanilytica TaxID=887459 RepID=UPI00255B2D77|nr:DUF1801 domain-containing protein [Actinomadura xylanilytica]MDL4772731.1 DUF1801 domain-containing protein [Actinomadura xylanilytica]